MGRKILTLAFLMSVLPSSALAGSEVVFTNTGGTLAGTNSGFSLTGSQLVSVTGLDAGGTISGPNLGSLVFSTGALSGGSLQSGGIFDGGSLTISGNGTSGVGSGVLFSGVFSQPLEWSLTTLWNGTHQYTLGGVLNGSLLGNVDLNGAHVQFTINTGKGFFNASAPLVAGATVISVPEPGSLAMIVLGLISLAAATRRKLLSR